MFIIQIYGVNGIFLLYHIKEVLFAYNGKLRTFINKADDKNVSLKSLNLSDVKLLIQCEVRVFIELDGYMIIPGSGGCSSLTGGGTLLISTLDVQVQQLHLCLIFQILNFTVVCCCSQNLGRLNERQSFDIAE